jgi:predicted acylesterase/phospholipase RssA
VSITTSSPHFKDLKKIFSLKNLVNFFLILDLKDDDHYALAFQGGGAKGLAYVGVYTALRKSKSSKSEKKGPIPIKSIIGSSAGGIFALAVSTAITPLELQKICYTMNQIPKKDRIYI